MTQTEMETALADFQAAVDPDAMGPVGKEGVHRRKSIEGKDET